MRLVTTWFGCFVLDDGNRIVEKNLFPADPAEISRRLETVNAGGLLPEEEKLARGRDVCVRERRLSELGSLIDFAQPDLRPEDFGFTGELLGKAMLSVGRSRVRAKSSPDEHIVQAIRATDDLAKIMNLMSERLHEWHALHFPELVHLVPEADYAKMIAELGSRQAMLGSGKVSIQDSIGGEASEADVKAVQALAQALLEAERRKTEIERYIELRMREIAPNTAHLAGPLLGARLISLTGGLDRLSRLPASTIQLLGAEKALFKHIKENARPPKHGVIFQHPIIHRAQPWLRGKIARAFAAKLAVAVRVDRYGHDFIGPKLEADLNRRIEDIKRRNPKPKERARDRRKGRK